MIKTDLHDLKYLEGPTRPFIWFLSKEHEVSLNIEDPFDEFDSTIVYSTTSAEVEAIINNEWDIPLDQYVGLNLSWNIGNVNLFGFVGDSGEASVFAPDNEFKGDLPILHSTKANVLNNVKDGNDSFMYAKTAKVENLDKARFNEVLLSFCETQYATILETTKSSATDAPDVKYNSAEASVINNSVDGLEDFDPGSSKLALTNLRITVNPLQFVEILLEFESKVDTVLQLPLGLYLTEDKKIVGVLQTSGTYDITIKLTTGDSVDGQIVCLPITRVA